MKMAPASRPKRVLVIGGGLAGLEAARVAAMRGHRVALYEEDGEIGGQWLIAARPPHKEEHTMLLDRLSWQLRDLGVECHLGQRADTATVRVFHPDVVIVATGARPLVPPIAGVDCPEVTTAWEVLQSGVAGRRVIVIGGGLTGLETAEFLAQGGSEVVVVEQLKRAGADMGATVRWHLMNRTRNLNIRVYTSTQVKEIRSGGVVVVSRKGSDETWTGFDTVVLACGARSRDELSAEIRDLVAEAYVIGDAAKPRRGLEAIREGGEAGRRI